MDARGAPWLLHGDTAWALITQLTQAEAEEYLENRRQKGFNSILTTLLEPKWADDRPRNRNGDAPFTTLWDFSTANEAYFAHVDRLLQTAREKGILIVLNPCDVSYIWPTATSNRGLYAQIIANGPAKCRDYGRYLGERYKDYPNIIWVAGGDMTPPEGSALEKNLLEVLLGIKDRAPNHLWCAHWYRFSAALDQSAFAPHLDLNNVYGGNRTYIQTLRAYQHKPPKPVFLLEAFYEDDLISPGGGTPQLIRAQAYWTLLSGASGQHLGSYRIWGFGAEIKGQRWDWREGLESPSSRDMVHVKRLFEGRAWYDLVPDADHTAVTNGYGKFGKDDRKPGGDYVTAARNGDGSLVMAYVPSTGKGTRTITVDMARLSHPANARWYNPTNGKFTEIAGSPLANSDSREFNTPGDNGTGTNDWVLVLETKPRRQLETSH